MVGIKNFRYSVNVHAAENVSGIETTNISDAN